MITAQVWAGPKKPFTRNAGAFAGPAEAMPAISSIYRRTAGGSIQPAGRGRSDHPTQPDRVQKFRSHTERSPNQA